ncbi:MAG: D-xylose transport system ATP-binding protein [Petroclostridium sp.]|uniref:xylose ABC transporter ATP-binding protein n=1 Tax=Petroclostridium xylanilyticum TaxID=1792311 RepID=UPI000B981E7D|nr:xylose ABC transporter ATP-binding protein [Petroclostridium xylanilyticum]MBZ4646599.1 transporter related protein [Clostridia bacterium]MDK2809944.1 D-xylose transport system ATP-binding protein [Petroclostridium sp.]
MSNFVLEMRNITKEFPGVKALNNVNFKVKKGEIHALCGENGAGKSTLMKVLSGVYPFGTYEGDIVINGKVQKFDNIRQSEEAGIAIIYQELALVKEMDIGQNIFLGAEHTKGGVIDWDKLYSEAAKLLKEMELDLNPKTKVKNLGIGQQQLVEIAKALSKKADILILDEPTAALTESEVKILVNILNKLREKGVSCIYISHKLNEVFELSDSITVLRDGQTVGTYPASDLNEDKVISLMVGRELTERFPREEHKPGETVLEVKNFSVYDPENPNKKIIDNVSFKIRKGEILGIAGLMGAGRTELITSIFGGFPGRKTGEIYLEGKKVNINRPVDAIKLGLAMVSEDRKRYGLILDQSVAKNITISSLDRICTASVINSNEEVKFSNKYVKDLRIKTPSIEAKVGTLSGGNQQKVVLGKWLMTEPKVLFLDEPTRGIDVGAKYEIYNIMNQLVRQGVAVVMVSSELPEVLGMSDRILVMHEGKLNGELKVEEATQERIMHCATGGR